MAATNRDLKAAVDRKEFREDTARLGVRLSPLRPRIKAFDLGD